MAIAPFAFKRVEQLPFVVVRAVTPEHFKEVFCLRAEAYSRHDYPLKVTSRMLLPDARDVTSTCLVALDKYTGQGLATVRLASNLDGPLQLPGQMPVASFMEEAFAFVDRFAASSGTAGQAAAMALMKAVWLWSAGRGVAWISAIGLKPLARRYEVVGLRPLAEQPNGFIFDEDHPKPFFTVAARMEHLKTNSQARHATLWDYFGETQHPDIQVFGTGEVSRTVLACGARLAARSQEEVVVPALHYA